jgi:hypothetical protein
MSNADVLFFFSSSEKGFHVEVMSEHVFMH